MFPFCPRELHKKGWQAGHGQCLGHCLHCCLHRCTAVTLLYCHRAQGWWQPLRQPPPWDTSGIPGIPAAPLQVPGSHAVPWAAPSRAGDVEMPTCIKRVVGKAGAPGQRAQRRHLEQAVIKWLSGCSGCQPVGAWP